MYQCMYQRTPCAKQLVSALRQRGQAQLGSPVSPPVKVKPTQSNHQLGNLFFPAAIFGSFAILNLYYAAQAIEVRRTFLRH